MKGCFSKMVYFYYFWIVISLIHFWEIYILFVIILKVTYFFKKGNFYVGGENIGTIRIKSASNQVQQHRVCKQQEERKF